MDAMRWSLSYSLLAALLFINVIPGNAQWVQASGPEGGSVNSILVAGGDTVFIGMDYGGIYRSTNCGESWESVVVTDTLIYAGAVKEIIRLPDGTLIAAGTYDVHRSTDNGSTWNPSGSGLPSSFSPCALAHHAGTGTVFVSSKSATDNVYRSTDGGISWSPANTGLPVGETLDLGVDTLNNKVYAACGSSKIYLSTNNGDSWSQVSTGLPATRFTDVLVDEDGTVFAGAENWGAGIFRSTDCGASWTNVGTSLLMGTFQGITKQGSSLVAVFHNSICPVDTCALNFIYCSEDEGDSWAEIGQVFYGRARAIAAKDSILLLGTNLGMMRLQRGPQLITPGHPLDNSGQKFPLPCAPIAEYLISDAGLRARLVTSLEGTNGLLLAGLGAGSLGVSSDTGESWDVILAPTYFGARDASSTQDGSIVVGDVDDPSRQTGVFFLPTGGQALQQLLPGSMYNSSYAHTEVNQTLQINAVHGSGFLGGFLLSSDGGWNFVQVNMGHPDPSRVNSMIFETVRQVLFAADDVNGIWYLTAQLVWAVLNSTPSFKIISDPVIGDLYSLIVVLSEYIIQKLPTGGGPPEIIPRSPVSISGRHLFTYACGALFLVDQNNVLWRYGLLSASAPTWTNISDGLPGAEILSMTAHNDRLFVGTQGYGIWSLDLTTNVDEEAGNPTEYQLSQNYPNPFNPETKIEYQIPTISHVTLKVFDLLGREVATLVDEIKPAGTYQMRFNAFGLSSGIYLYKLSAGEYSQVRKMAVVK